jgi:hypothetical protein
MRLVSIVSLLAALVVAAPALHADEGANLAKDPGFEEPGSGDQFLLNWVFYTSKDRNIALTNNPVHSGTSSVRLWTQGRKDAHLGISQEHEVIPKGKYTFRVFVMNDKDDKLGGTAVGNLSIEWFDAEGAEISRAFSKEWTSHLSKLRWQEVEVSAKAPLYATKVKFVIILRDGLKIGEGGIYVDDASITVKQK